MKKRGIAVLIAVFVLLAANMVTVFAEGDVEPMAMRVPWYVSSYPGIAGGDSVTISRDDDTYFSINTEDYYSSGDSNGIQVTSTGSNETLYITATGTRKMTYKAGLDNGYKLTVSFYAYSSNSRIYGKGTVATL